jgi:hypothetical protein
MSSNLIASAILETKLRRTNMNVRELKQRLNDLIDCDDCEVIVADEIEGNDCPLVEIQQIPAINPNDERYALCSDEWRNTYSRNHILIRWGGNRRR